MKKHRIRSVKTTLTATCMALVLLAAALLGAAAIFSIRTATDMAMTEYESAMDSGYKSEIQSEVETVIAVLQHEYDQYRSGKLTEREAMDEAMEIVRDMRYRADDSGYFWIDDTDYTLVMHPILTDQEGTNRHELQDQNGVMIIQEIMKVCSGAEGGGFNEFYFTKSDGVTVAPKVAYSELFQPWGWVVSTGNYVDDMKAEMSGVADGINEKFTSLCVFTLVLVGVMLVIAFIWSRIYAHRLCRPLVKLQGLADRLSEGDLTTGVDVKERNEIGETASALNTAQEHMVSLISEVSTASSDLKAALDSFSADFASMQSSIGNVSIAVNGIAQNNTEQAASTTEASNNVMGIADGVRKISDEAEKLLASAGQMQDYAQRSLTNLEELIETSGRTETDIQSMHDQTESTNVSVKKINKAAALISDIAEQTNLLSLNASIEAARAGEAGRGFAVVAEEINTLATQSAETASEISGIIGELTTNSERSMGMMAQMNDAAKAQVEALNRTSEMFRGMQAALEDCAASVRVVTDMVRSANAEQANVTKNIEILTQIATGNAASTEETSSMTSELEGTIRRSSSTVGRLEEDIKVLAENLSHFHL